MNKLILITTTFITLNTYAGGWIDDWVDQSTHSGPNYFDGQQRGYFNGGSYSVRFRNKKDYLFSIQKPRVKSGCGGIDMFMGGFSFMDPEYLMQKLQRALQAAPAVAFDLALKTTCKDCASTLKALEAITNKLNNLQMDECATSKEIVSAFTKDGYEAQGGIFSEMRGLFDREVAAKEGSTKNSYNTAQKQTSNGNKAITDQSKAIEGCSAEFKKAFATPGSFLENISKAKGLEEYADYMRAYVGDVIIVKVDNTFNYTPVSKCPKADVTKIDDIIVGNAQIKPSDNTSCTNSNDVSLIIKVEDRLNSIATKIRSKSKLSTSEINFLNAIPYNIHSALAKAVRGNFEAEYIKSFKDTIAKMMAYALIDDLIENIREVVRTAMDNAKLSSSGGDSSKMCEQNALPELMSKISELKKETIELQKAARLARREQIKEVNNNIEFNKNISK